MTTIFNISEINSIRFADQNANISNYKNELSWQENTAINNRMYAQKRLASDKVKIQIKSNLTDVAVNLYDLCDPETAVQTPELIKKTNNIGLVDTFSNGFTGTYDDNGTNKRMIYFDDGFLPEYVTAGTEIAASSTLSDPTSATYYPVEKIINDPDKDAYLAIFDASPVSGIDIPRNVAIKYNAQDYEVYESTIDLTELDGYYFIEVTASDEDTSYLKVSEIQEVRESYRDTHRIDYMNSENNAILWATGIGYTLHLPYVLDMKAAPESTNETITIDDTLYQTDSSLFVEFTLAFEKMPVGVAKTLMLAFAQDSVYVDGIPVIRTEAEMTPFGSTNEYQVTITARQSSEDLTGGILVDDLGDIENLLQDANGLILNEDETIIQVD